VSFKLRPRLRERVDTRAPRRRDHRKKRIYMKFSDLGLAAPILRALDGEGYQAPTPIQAKAIPIVLTGGDLLGIAQTGTGKTAAFALPIIQRLASDRRPAMRKGCRVLVLAPTRELASQIAESFRTYGRHVGLSVAVIFGGVGYRPQIQALARGVDVLVATPGRLVDHIADRNVLLAGTEALVLDEADHMLDLGFLPAIRRVIAQLSSKRQNLFFSATMPPEISKLANDLLRDPVRVAVAPVGSTVDRVTQRVLHVEHENKRSLLVELFSDPQMSRTLVFTRTKRGADRVARHLDAAGIRVAAIHGNKSQSQREQALAAFRAAKVRALVATDIAARGIDIDEVTHVVNYELPDVPESYVHRIGRTARAGARGIAISLCDTDERGQLRDIERLTRQSIPSEDRRGAPGSLPEASPPAQPDRRNGHAPRGRHGRPGGRQQRAPQGPRHPGEGRAAAPGPSR
jgi:ATP-dependent RNA helicase RhlE